MREVPPRMRAAIITAPKTCEVDLTAAIERLATGGLEPERLYTHRVPLERASEAFEALRTRPIGFVKAMVTP